MNLSTYFSITKIGMHFKFICKCFLIEIYSHLIGANNKKICYNKIYFIITHIFINLHFIHCNGKEREDIKCNWNTLSTFMM
ncbi:MAG: hypothetical protein K0R54_411 [Clostridiaceae bacterium]|nr:hypothetical protein [Clostridiaceae bacterium]